MCSGSPPHHIVQGAFGILLREGFSHLLSLFLSHKGCPSPRGCTSPFPRRLPLQIHSTCCLSLLPSISSPKGETEAAREHKATEPLNLLGLGKIRGLFLLWFVEASFVLLQPACPGFLSSREAGEGMQRQMTRKTLPIFRRKRRERQELGGGWTHQDRAAALLQKRPRGQTRFKSLPCLKGFESVL